MKKINKKFNKINKTNKENGITLIALVITIVILIILAVVTVNAVFGDSGLLEQAGQAKETTERASVIEQAQIDILGIQAGGDITITNEQLKSVLEKYFDEVPEDVDINDILTTKEEYGGKYQISVSEIYNGKIKESLIPSGLEIGSTVAYTPSGIYNWQSKYYYFSNEAYTDVILDSSSDNYKISTWKVLELDETTGKITLVPTAPTTGKVILGGAQGYNNAVYLLNEACSNLYGDNSKGIMARSINIEDIEKYMKEEALEEAYTNGFTNTPYGKQVSSAYISSRFYPIIYAEEKLSVIDGTENTTGLEMSEQKSLVEPTNETDPENGRMIATTSIQPYQTLWMTNGSLTQTDFKDIDNSGQVSNYYNLIMPNGIDTEYGLASRVIDANSGACTFAISSVDFGMIYMSRLVGSSSSNSISNLALFPIVTINSEFISGNAKEGFKVE